MDKWVEKHIDEIIEIGYGEIVLKIHNHEITDIEKKTKERKILTKEEKELK